MALGTYGISSGCGFKESQTECSSYRVIFRFVEVPHEVLRILASMKAVVGATNCPGYDCDRHCTNWIKTDKTSADSTALFSIVEVPLPGLFDIFDPLAQKLDVGESGLPPEPSSRKFAGELVKVREHITFGLTSITFIRTVIRVSPTWVQPTWIRSTRF